MPPCTRREFSRHALRSLTALALIEGLAARRLFGSDVAPIVAEWLTEMDTISRELKDQKLKDVAYQEALEGLYRRADLPALLRSLDLDRLAAGIEYPERGAKSLPADFREVSEKHAYPLGINSVFYALTQ